ncbi:MAG TPA: GGDEF domain-containing protein [Acidimicrobiales bacterium]|nr:GGDEF domain-containing protein [Acidimicrobiales bacterium]
MFGGDNGGPQQASVAAMRRLAASIFLVGAGTCALGVATKYASTTPLSRTAQFGCSAAFLACGLLVALSRPGRRAILACVLAALAVLGVLMAFSNPVGMGPLFYLWPVAYTAYFYPPRVLAAVMATMAVSLGLGLASNPHEHLLADTFVGVCASVGVMGWVVALMTRQQARLRRELALAAQTDPLTGLLNRRAFDPAFTDMISASKATGAALAVVLFDIDFFKSYNDNYGHLAGDAALRVLAGVLRTQSRAEDAVCRFGGEEFVVALAGTGGGDARAFVQRVADALSTAQRALGGPFTISAGIGVMPRDGDNYELLVKTADEALYGAKESGRARMAWHSEAGQISLCPLGSASALTVDNPRLAAHS